MEILIGTYIRIYDAATMAIQELRQHIVRYAVVLAMLHKDTSCIQYVLSLAVGQKVLTAYFTHLGHDAENLIQKLSLHNSI